MKNILHLMTKLPDKYNSKYVEFANHALPDYNHTFICLVSGSGLDESLNQLNSVNIINLNNRGKLVKWIEVCKLLTSKQYDLNIFHGLFYTGPFLIFLAAIFRVFSIGEKTLWMTWGGDIYYFQNRAKTVSGWLNEQFRKSIIKRFSFISSPIKGEVDLVKLTYKSNAIEFSTLYPNPLPYQDITAEHSVIVQDEKVHLMIGNSADPQNNHLAILEQISHLRGSVKVTCVLSYANVDSCYTEAVIKQGEALFSDDFYPIRDFMAPNDYSQLLSGVDIAIYYHNRQQAMGNIYQFLYLGKSVFVRSDTLSNQHLKLLGFKVCDSEKLSQVSIAELQVLKQDSNERKIENQAIINEYCSDRVAKKLWDEALLYIFALLKKSD